MVASTEEFEILTKEEAERIKEHASANGHRPYSPVTKALLAGETVFLSGKVSYNTGTFAKQGFRLRSSRGEHNGKDGVYIWLEQKG